MTPRRNGDLPILPMPLIGREAEIAEARRLLTRIGGSRLLTLTGPPGVGKTSLALTIATALADELRYDARLIDLTPIEDAALVAGAIADGLGVRRSGDRPPLEQAIRSIRDRRLLLVLDNFEQVVDAAALVAELLAACPNLIVLATSRVSLRIPDETDLAVPPLALPDLNGACVAGRRVVTPDDASSVALFVARARAVSSRFALSTENAWLVGEICVALEGLPLAIELAAARIRTLSLVEIHASLVGEGDPASAARQTVPALTLLADGPRDLPRRQRSLRDAIGWSYNLLHPAEQALFRQLGVFVGGCTFEAATTVCDGSWEQITALVEHHLVRYEEPAPGSATEDAPELRIRLLESVRQFAVDQLTDGDEWETMRGRHAAYFVDLAEQASPRLEGPGQVAWMDRLARDAENFRAVERRAVAAGDLESVMRLNAALVTFWRGRSDAADARRRVAAILALAPAAPQTPAGAKALYGAGDQAIRLGDYAAGQQLLERSLAISRAIGDRSTTAFTLSQLSRLAGERAEYAEAERLGEECAAIFLELGDDIGLSAALNRLGRARSLMGDHLGSRAIYERALIVANRTGDPRALGTIVFGLALTHHYTGSLETAQQLYRECLETYRALGYGVSVGAALHNLGHVATLRGHPREARALLRESLLVSRAAGARARLGTTLTAVAALAVMEREPARAVRLDAASAAALAALGSELAPSMRALCDRQLAPAWAALGDEGVAATEAAGRLLTLDEAVDEALAWLGDDSATAGGREKATQSAPIVSAPPEPSPPPRRASTSPDPSVLTRRERDVAVLLGRGFTTSREIAQALSITEGTADNYVKRVLSRLDLRTRAQIVAWAAEHRLAEAAADT